MVTSLSDLGVALYCRLVWLYRAFTWKYVYRLARAPGADRSVLGRVFQRWLPAPGKASIAELADVVEKTRDPVLVESFAALLQRAAVADLKIKRYLMELATHVEELGRFEPGCNRLAVQAAEELDELLAAPEDSWSTLEEVLGEAHCHPVDLLVVTWSRLLAEQGSQRILVTLMRRLRKSVDALVEADPELSEELKRRMIRRRSDQELLLFGHRVAGSAWEVGDLAALRVGLLGVDEGC